MKEGGCKMPSCSARSKIPMLYYWLYCCIPWKGAIALSYPLYGYCTAVFAGNDTFLNRKHHSR